MYQDLAEALPGTTYDPRYPDSDGRFMGDTDFHNVAIIQTREALEDRYVDENVYIATNIVMYFQEGSPKSRRDPDVLVAKGVGKHKRRSFRFWEEKRIPNVLFEMASKKTWRNDVGEKRWLYARLGIKDYFIFDPEAKYLEPTLQGFRLVNGRSVRIKPNPDGTLTCKELGLLLRAEGTLLRFIDMKTGQLIPTRSERAALEEERADRETERAEKEAERAQKLAAEVEQLKARLRKLES
ncbi:MAG: Uma2 family endonuclease [Gemmataceae bacterium]|nr:Uma2 family endonuclease [Gemmataceae bacterium]